MILKSYCYGSDMVWVWPFKVPVLETESPVWWCWCSRTFFKRSGLIVDHGALPWEGINAGLKKCVSSLIYPWIPLPSYLIMGVFLLHILLPWDPHQRPNRWDCQSWHLASKTMSQINLFSLYITQSCVFSYSNRKWTNTTLLLHLGRGFKGELWF